MFKSSNEQTLKQAIELLLHTYHLKDKLSEVDIVNSWETLVGKAVANRTSEVFVRNKKLYIRLTSASLRNDLAMAKSSILELVNERAGQVLVEEVILL